MSTCTCSGPPLSRDPGAGLSPTASGPGSSAFPARSPATPGSSTSKSYDTSPCDPSSSNPSGVLLVFGLPPRARGGLGLPLARLPRIESTSGPGLVRSPPPERPSKTPVEGLPTARSVPLPPDPKASNGRQIIPLRRPPQDPGSTNAQVGTSDVPSLVVRSLLWSTSIGPGVGNIPEVRWVLDVI